MHKAPAANHRKFAGTFPWNDTHTRIHFTAPRFYHTLGRIWQKLQKCFQRANCLVHYRRHWHDKRDRHQQDWSKGADKHAWKTRKPPCFSPRSSSSRLTSARPASTLAMKTSLQHSGKRILSVPIFKWAAVSITRARKVCCRDRGWREHDQYKCKGLLYQPIYPHQYLQEPGLQAGWHPRV